MLKYVPKDASVTFAEIPDEICLCFNLSLCPHRCQGCHSQYLQTDFGDELTINVIDELIHKNNGITCVVFMGGDIDKSTLKLFAHYIKSKYKIKTGWYSGEYYINLNEYFDYFDYIKVGPYIEKLGPLNVKTTNQRMYHLYDNKYEDITNRFWEKSIVQ